jgi:pyoverdine/dityrosine biosynthesis protein Dit1
MTDFNDRNMSLTAIREKIMGQFGITPIELERRILMDTDVNILYRGMIKFMNLDLAIKDFASNSQLQKQSKVVAKEMMFRNEAYSTLIRSEFSDHIRLSMHHSINNGTKYSFQLIRSTGNVFTSAWHCALAIRDGIIETIHKRDAIAQGFELVSVGGQPYFYQK